MIRDGLIKATTGTDRIPESEIARILAARSEESSVTASQAAVMLMVTSQWVRKMVKKGTLTPVPKQPGTRLRIPVAELRRFARDLDMELKELD